MATFDVENLLKRIDSKYNKCKQNVEDQHAQQIMELGFRKQRIMGKLDQLRIHEKQQAIQLCNLPINNNHRISQPINYNNLYGNSFCLPLAASNSLSVGISYPHHGHVVQTLRIKSTDSINNHHNTNDNNNKNNNYSNNIHNNIDNINNHNFNNNTSLKMEKNVDRETINLCDDDNYNYNDTNMDQIVQKKTKTTSINTTIANQSENENSFIFGNDNENTNANSMNENKSGRDSIHHNKNKNQNQNPVSDKDDSQSETETESERDSDNYSEYDTDSNQNINNNENKNTNFSRNNTIDVNHNNQTGETPIPSHNHGNTNTNTNAKAKTKRKTKLTAKKLKNRNLISPINPRLCPVATCKKVFYHPASFNNHLQTHGKCDEIPFQCTIDGCSKVFTTNALLRTHQRIHTSIIDENCVCENCRRPFRSIKALNIHKAHARKNGGKYCISFKAKSTKPRRTMSIIGSISSINSSISPDGKYRCDNCQRLFRSKKGLHYHQNDAKRNGCNYKESMSNKDKKSSKSKSTRRKSMYPRINISQDDHEDEDEDDDAYEHGHEQEKQIFQCQNCNQRLYGREQLKIHMLNQHSCTQEIAKSIAENAMALKE